MKTRTLSPSSASRSSPAARRPPSRLRALGCAALLAGLAACGEAETGTFDPPRIRAAAVTGSATGAMRIAYGPDPQQFGDLRVPAGPGPHPVAVLIHGGCWTSFFGLELMDAISEALTREGVATWNIEFRRIMDPGGGYPSTLTDVGLAVDHLRVLAPSHALDLDRVVTVGHSAGGHLGVWVAARHRLPATSALRGTHPLPLLAAVGLAPILDLEAYLNLNVCGEFVDDFIGGTPEDVPERYAETSPVALLPLGVDVTIVQGAADDIVPPGLARDYVRAARRAGDQVVLKKVQGGDHFVVIDPTSDDWPRVRSSILKAIRKE